MALGETGDCHVRKNIDGTVRCTTYGKPCSVNVDPVEKKPLYHFLPGSPILSIATVGCNLHCKQCQNWSISQASQVHSPHPEVLPDEVAQLAIKQGCPAIAYTYTEPLVSYEYTYDCCEAASAAGLKNVLVTAAYINPEPLRHICRFTDAANVDLKAFTDDFYRNVCGARLQPVLKALVTMKECGVMLEITNLIIPTLNDSEVEIRNLCLWVVENLGAETPLHFSRFFPQHRLRHLPLTTEVAIRRARDIALECGLFFFYVGNMSDGEGEHTWCKGCGTLLIERHGYQISKNILQNGSCPRCGSLIYGVWK